MRVRLILCLTLVPLFLCAGERKDKSKPAALEISAFKVEQNGSTVSYEGRLRNVSSAPIGHVKLTFTLLGADGAALGRASGEVDGDEIAPGDEAPFAFEMPWKPDAVSVKVEAHGPQSKEIKLSGEGPYKIE